MYIEDLDEFNVEWNKLALLGKVDSFGGVEYRVCLKAFIDWLWTGSCEDVIEFLEEYGLL